MHEAIHNIDYVKRFTKTYKSSQFDLSSSDSAKAYYNSPIEFNAYFQGNINDFENSWLNVSNYDIENNLDEICRYMLTLNLSEKDLFNYILPYFPQKESYTKENKKRLYKRIHEYIVNDLKKQFHDMSTKINSEKFLVKQLTKIFKQMMKKQTAQLHGSEMSNRVEMIVYIKDFDARLFNGVNLSFAVKKFLNPTGIRILEREEGKFLSGIMDEWKISLGDLK